MFLSVDMANNALKKLGGSAALISARAEGKFDFKCTSTNSEEKASISSQQLKAQEAFTLYI